MKYFIVKGTGVFSNWFYLRSKKEIKTSEQRLEIRRQQEELGIRKDLIDAWVERQTYEIIAEVTLDRVNYIATEKKSGQKWEYQPYGGGMAFKRF